MSPRSSAPAFAARRPPPFRYKHAGDLATIGKRRAVIDFGWIKLKGGFAWWLWGVAHIYFLIGVRNRLSVAINWLWIYAATSAARGSSPGWAARSREPSLSHAIDMIYLWFIRALWVFLARWPVGRENPSL